MKWIIYLVKYTRKQENILRRIHDKKIKKPSKKTDR